MDLLKEIVKVLGCIIIVYLSIPWVAAILVASFSPGYTQRGMEEGFDFFADILYPWRWEYKPWKIGR